MFDISEYKDIIVAKKSKTDFGMEMRLCLFVIDGLLFDCGPSSIADEVKEFLLSQEISQIAITHLHEDHAGLAAWAQKDLNVPIYLHADDIPLAKFDGDYPLWRQLIFGDRPAFSPEPMPEVLRTPKYCFEVISTPGHTKAHNAFYERKMGWLFAGDLYVTWKIRAMNNEGDMKEFIDSIEKVLKLDFNTVFCAHCGVIENGREKLEQKLAYMLDLQLQVNDLRAKGMDDHEIDQQLFQDQQFLIDATDSDWISYYLVSTI